MTFEWRQEMRERLSSIEERLEKIEGVIMQWFRDFNENVVEKEEEKKVRIKEKEE